MEPLRKLFPRLENRTTVATADEVNRISTEGKGLLGPAVDYMVCLLSDVFMPTYDGPSNFANNLLGHRLYSGFRTSIRPDRKALAPIFMEMEEGSLAQEQFEEKVKVVMQSSWIAGPHTRVEPESFYTNPWPECFCNPQAAQKEDHCPGDVQFLAQVGSDQDNSETSTTGSDAVAAQAGAGIDPHAVLEGDEKEQDDAKDMNR
jgi:hypothetical protein